jgi:hypothetical protein
MRHTVSVALSVLFFLLPAFAQRGGGRGAGSVSARGGSSFRGSVASSGFHGGSFQARSSYPIRTQVPTRNWAGYGGYGYGYGWHRHYPYYPYYGYVGYGYAYPYAYFGFSNGFYSSTYYSDQNSDYYAQQNAQLNAEIGSLNQQMQDLRDQNDNLRDYVDRSGAAAAARAPVPNVPSSLAQPMQAEPPVPPTVLVFKDGHTTEVHNYAIVGSTLWALSQNRSQKYAVSDLDIDKTIQENEKRGVEFTAPTQK